MATKAPIAKECRYLEKCFREALEEDGKKPFFWMTTIAGPNMYRLLFMICSKAIDAHNKGKATIDLSCHALADQIVETIFPIIEEENRIRNGL